LWVGNTLGTQNKNQTDSKFSLSNEKRKASSLILHIMCDIDQEQTNHLENCIEESNVFGSMNDEVSNMEEEDKSKNDENSEDNSYHLNRQEATTESTRPISEIATLEDMVRNQEI